MIIAFVLPVLLFGCGADRDASAVPESRGASPQSDALLAARVDGEPITVDEVTALMTEVDGGLDAAEAVDVLVRHRLLAAEARRRGMDRLPEVAAVEKVAKAKAVLDVQIRRGITPETVDDETVRRYYNERLRQYVHGPMRKVVHFVALTGKKGQAEADAKRLAEKVYDGTAGLTSASAFRRVAEKAIENPDHAKVESLPLFDAESTAFVAPFVKAAFDAPVGRRSPPVHTRFGWHVIYVVDEEPGLNRSFEEVKDALRSELVPKLRAEKAGALVGRLLEENPPFVYEDALSSWSVNR